MDCNATTLSDTKFISVDITLIKYEYGVPMELYKDRNAELPRENGPCVARNRKWVAME